MVCKEVVAVDVFVDGKQITDLSQRLGQIEILALDEIEFNESRQETIESLDARLVSARRLAALLYFPAISSLQRRRALTEGIFDQSDFPCLDALKHLGRSAVVDLARSVAGPEVRDPTIGLARSACLVDLATHLEGMIVEARDPLSRQRIRQVLNHARSYLKGQKTQLQMAPTPYPALYEMISADDFDK